MRTYARTASRARRLLACAVAVAVTGGLTVLPADATVGHIDTTDTTDERAAGPKIPATLKRTLRAAKGSPFWVRFADRADLSAARRIGDWEERGTAVAEALRSTAQRSQRNVRAALDAADVDYQAFWATNAIYVEDGSLELAEKLAAEPEVRSLHPTTTYEVPEPIAGEADESGSERTRQAVEWGIASIKADEVWDQYGARGAGITVANIDTGVQYDHPALVEQYRDNLGDGRFSHDYNWFDASERCGGAPCDTDGHGTHTMGTMAGDDGGENRIGVAPDVQWIAANGCCPSDASLIASGQWMLQPTDLEGERPDAGKRPHIINNSWGSGAPSNDPFMEDISLAWEASGIFAMWSNGNNAPGCKTSGSPGSRIVNYSAGAYDSENTIAWFSSRGDGQDGEIKPNIAAPGVGIRSAVPWNGYAEESGTSMAAPHVAGAVALLWSAAPTLIGEVEETRKLLDGSAVDTPDDECGGTAADNNVFGEGRLDALALLDAAPIGASGVLTATVTDARTREPVADATVTVSGPVDRERRTGADGTERLPLPPGKYTVTVSAFGYVERSATVTIDEDRTTSEAFRLTPIRRVNLEGRVTDGSGQAWPLYAALTVDGMPGGTFFTNPSDGRFRIPLPIDGTYTVRIEARSDGYEPVTQEVKVGRRHVRKDVVLSVDTSRCVAPGYAYAYDGARSAFDDGLPTGWTVVDHSGAGETWRFDDPEDEGNRTGGEGAFAIAQSIDGDSPMDTSLVSPAVDLTGHEAPIVDFRQAFHRLREVADVDLSLDDGRTWETILHQTDAVAGPDHRIIPVPQAAGKSAVRLRFHYSDAIYRSRYWQVDDAFLGTRTCEPVPGGLVQGYVRDRNTGAVLNGATVSVHDGPRVRSAPTPDDPGLADGFFSTFVADPGPRTFTADLEGYGYSVAEESVVVRARTVTWKEFRLAAGRLSVRPDEVSATARIGGKPVQRTVTVTNSGSAPTTVEFSERRGTFAAASGADGTVRSEAEILSSPGAEVVRIEGDYSPLALGKARPGAAKGGPPGKPGEAPESPWVGIAEYPTRIMDNVVAEHDGAVYSVGGLDGVDITAASHVYDPATERWSPIADLPEGRENAAGAFIDGLLYVSGGWGPDVRAKRTTFVYDPEKDAWESRADAPVSTAGAGRAVLDGFLYVIGGCTNACDGRDVQRYDPRTDTWTLLADYPMPAGHLACGAIDGLLYCAGGVRRGGTVWNQTYAYDPATDTWSPRADMPMALYGMGYGVSHGRLLVSGGSDGDVITNEGFAYEPDTDTWSRLPASGVAAYRGGSACGLYRIGGSVRSGFVPTARAELLPTYGDCEPADVPWLSLETKPGAHKVTLKPGRSVRVTVTLDPVVARPGTYTAGIWIKEGTPYLVYPIDVTLSARPPQG
ncbi:MAG TPA: S8 family serine peptidase [Actinopolymorphaceae bacterium]